MSSLRGGALRHASKKPTARPRRFIARMCLLSLAVFSGLVVTGCGARQAGRSEARVRFVLEPPTARVYAEDRFIGAGRVLRQRSRRFPTGPRHFTVTADGYFPHDVELDLPSGLTTVRLRLRPLPP